MMLPRPASVVHEVELRLVSPGEDGLLLTATLRYEAADPFAVQAVFRAGDDAVAWVLGRDLLSEGLLGDSGEGDVRVWPTTDRSRPVVMLQLSSPDGRALLAADAEDVRSFLRRTYAAVPAGREAEQLDVDAALEQLLA
jgi:hypothetical protein